MPRRALFRSLSRSPAATNLARNDGTQALYKAYTAMADSTLDHMRMKERVRGEFTIDKGAMTEYSPSLGSPWILVLLQSHQKFGSADDKLFSLR
jgi:hypothetical protein